jgi:ribosomal protein S18 acetylase RimI-like enzyme
LETINVSIGRETLAVKGRVEAFCGQHVTCRPVPSVTISRAATVDDELVGAFARLVPQLSRSAPPPGRAELNEIVTGPSTILLLARSETSAIVGTLTLVLFRIPTGVRAWIEDVVVDQDTRGSGAGAALTEEALRIARAAGARTVDLTSNPSREAANRLYQRLGFGPRDTNVYRYDLGA